MFVKIQKGKTQFLVEWHLCSKCARWMCTSLTEHVFFKVDGMYLHMHIECPPNKFFDETPKLEE